MKVRVRVAGQRLALHFLHMLGVSADLSRDYSGVGNTSQRAGCQRDNTTHDLWEILDSIAAVTSPPESFVFDCLYSPDIRDRCVGDC